MSSAISRRLPLLLLVGVLLALVIYLQWPESAVIKDKNKRVISVKTALIKKAKFTDSVEAVGTSRANEKVLITSKYSDLVDEILFKDGQSVAKGDILVLLNSQEEAAKVKELVAKLSESNAQLNRYQDLFKTKAISKAIVDQESAKNKAISAQLLSAKIKLNDFIIKAPFSGVLGFREISVGALIKVGGLITSLDDLSVIKVDFAIPERYLTTVSIGQVIEATSIAYSKKIFIGKVTSIDSRVDSVTRTLKIRAEIPNPKRELRAGMLLNVKIVRNIEQILQLPESAVIPIEDDHFVFVVEDKKAIKKQFIIGRRRHGFVEVISGLNEGSEIVIEGALKLRDGTAVSVLEK